MLPLRPGCAQRGNAPPTSSTPAAVMSTVYALPMTEWSRSGEAQAFVRRARQIQTAAYTARAMHAREQQNGPLSLVATKLNGGRHGRCGALDDGARMQTENDSEHDDRNVRCGFFDKVGRILLACEV